MKLWIARDIDNGLYLYTSEPVCGEDGIFYINKTDSDDIIKLDSNECAIVTFENSPQEVELSLPNLDIIY